MDEPSFLDFLNAFGAIATPVLMLVLTAIGWNVRTRLQRRHDLEDKLREDRISIYNEILEPFIIMLTSDAAWRSDPANKNKDKYAIATTKMLSFQYRKTGFRMSLIGSDAVIRAYNELMQYFFQRQGQSAPPAEAEVKNMMSMLGTLLLEIRRSMGNEATKVDNWEMLVHRHIQRIHSEVRLWHTAAMAQIVCPLVSAEDRARLEAIVADRNRAQKHVARARIILGSAERLPVATVAKRAGVGRPAVWRWQRRFAETGVDGLLRDASRKPGKAPLGNPTIHRVVALSCAEPPGEATHWTGRAMAKTVGISLRSVQRIWAAHDLQPHRLRTFKRSTDPDFAAKLADIVGLYVDPPKHAVVLSVDEKSQIQALDRTQPGLPLKPGKAGTMTHDYLRNGITTLFAAFDVLDGTVLGRCMQRHRHQEFLRFLNTIERAIPAGKVIHVILDNYGNHKHPKVLKWLARHPRWVFHFTPTSGSWLNAVETFFSALTRRRLKRGSFHSIVDLQAAINRYIAEHNDDPKPFTWTKTPHQILAKLNPLNAPVH